MRNFFKKTRACLNDSFNSEKIMCYYKHTYIHTYIHEDIELVLGIGNELGTHKKIVIYFIKRKYLWIFDTEILMRTIKCFFRYLKKYI